MKTYAIADLHGRYDLLVSAYRLLEQNEPGRNVPGGATGFLEVRA